METVSERRDASSEVTVIVAGVAVATEPVVVPDQAPPLECVCRITRSDVTGAWHCRGA